MKVLCMILLCVKSWIRVDTGEPFHHHHHHSIDFFKISQDIALIFLHQLKSYHLLALGLFNAHES